VSGSLWQKTHFAYDTSGNQTSATLTFRDRSGAHQTRTSTTQYDPSKRYPIRTTNALNQSQTATYHSGLGVVLTSTDANNFRVHNFYDGLGRAYGSSVYNSNGEKLSETFESLEATGLQGHERYRVRKLSSGGDEAIVYFDELQRSVRGETRSFTHGVYAQTTTTYDTYGRMVQATAPSGSGTATTTITYDSLGRNVRENIQTSDSYLSTTTHYGVFANTDIAGRTHSGTRVTSTQSGTGVTERSVTTYTNHQGLTVRVTDAMNNPTDFVHDVFGNLLQAIGPTGIAENMAYDLRGRKLSQQNPDSGHWQYRYNGAGELVEQIDARGYSVQNHYDVLGRLIERHEYGASGTPRVTVWSYDAYADGGSCGIGRLCETRLGTQDRNTIGVALPNPEQRQIITYDFSGRVINTALEIGEMRFVQASAYDHNSRVIANAHPSGYITYNSYSSWTGELIDVSDGQTSHWRATSRNLDGGLTQATLGNAIPQHYGYDGFGRLASARSDNQLQNATFTFDALGNLTHRADTTANLNENFGYDLLNRLTNTPQGIVSYDAAGNIILRENKHYAYQNGTHRLVNMEWRQYQYDANGNVTAIIDAERGDQTLTYGIHNLPDTIKKGTTTLSYRYAASGGRISETVTTDNTSVTTWYLGGFEVKHSQDGGIEERHYISGAEGVIGIHTRSYGQQAQGVTSGSRTRYWIKDHLGSVTAIADEQGNLVQRYAFDAWGRRSETILNPGEIAEERGFTGHEQLVEIGLVHMNGRLYDPESGRMLQADPIIQSPYDGQNYNRYSYVLNNPLSLTDPTGFSFWKKLWKPFRMIAVAVAAYFTAGQILPYLAPSFFVASTAGAPTFGSFLVSAFSGAVSGVVGGGGLQGAGKGAFFASFFWMAGTFSESFSGTIAKGAARVASHAAVGCMQSASAGGSCGSGAASAGISALVPDTGSHASNLAARAATGALASAITGGNAGEGAVIAVFGYLFNECAHDRCIMTDDQAAAALYDLKEANAIMAVDAAASICETLPNSFACSHFSKQADRRIFEAQLRSGWGSGAVQPFWGVEEFILDRMTGGVRRFFKGFGVKGQGKGERGYAGSRYKTGNPDKHKPFQGKDKKWYRKDPQTGKKIQVPPPQGTQSFQANGSIFRNEGFPYRSQWE
jgi:RHS repeat-associated protein